MESLFLHLARATGVSLWLGEWAMTCPIQDQDR
jgi:hypothetical protein